MQGEKSEATPCAMVSILFFQNAVWDKLLAFQKDNGLLQKCHYDVYVPSAMSDAKVDSVDRVGPRTKASPDGFRFSKDTLEALVSGTDVKLIYRLYCRDLGRLDAEIRDSPDRVVPKTDLESSKYVTWVCSVPYVFTVAAFIPAFIMEVTLQHLLVSNQRWFAGRQE